MKTKAVQANLYITDWLLLVFAIAVLCLTVITWEVIIIGGLCLAIIAEEFLRHGRN